MIRKAFMLYFRVYALLLDTVPEAIILIKTQLPSLL